jgi:hypothetical protein
MSIIAKMSGILRSKCALRSTRNFVFECKHDRLRALTGARRIFEPAKTLKKQTIVFSRNQKSAPEQNFAPGSKKVLRGAKKVLPGALCGALLLRANDHRLSLRL